MAEGNETYQGGAVPIYPANGMEIKQQTASSAVDILTITAASSGTGDFLVMQNSSGTEKFAVAYDGSVTHVAGAIDIYSKTDQTTFARLRLPILSSAPASAGLTKGEIWLAAAGTTDMYRLAMCVSTATGAVKYGRRMITSTIGATT